MRDDETIILTRRNILAISAFAGGISMVAPAWAQFKRPTTKSLKSIS